MQTKFILGPVGAVLLGVCFLIGKNDMAAVAEQSAAAAAAPAKQAADRDVARKFPVLFDYREVLAAHDVSGLAQGTHTIGLTFYAPTAVGWTPEAERVVRDGIRVVHVDDQKPAAVRIAFGPEGKTGARRVQVDVDLLQAGSYVVLLGDGLLAAHADPELLAHYAVRDPETLKPRGDYEFLEPNLMLRTVGHCNHVHEVITRVDGTGTLYTVELHFSEPLESGAMAGGLDLGLTDTEGRRGRSARAEEVRVHDNVVELHVPKLPDQAGTLEIPLARIRNIAGRFRDELSCDEVDGAIGVGYVFGGQHDGEHVIAPLRQAASRALGEDRKSP
jgi:hypothetical protein